MIHRIVKLHENFKIYDVDQCFIIITFGASGPEPFVTGVSVAGAAHIFTITFYHYAIKNEIGKKTKNSLILRYSNEMI